MLLEFMNRKSVLKQKNKVAIMSLLMEIGSMSRFSTS